MNETKEIEKHLPLVVKQALQFKPTPLSSTEDYIQAGLIGLLLAIRSFDPTKNTKLSSYAWKLVYQQIIKEWQKAGKTKFSQLNDQTDHRKNSEIEEICPQLSENEQKILLLRTSGYSYKEIGQQFGNKNPETIRQRLEKIYQKIRESNAEKAHPIL